MSQTANDTPLLPAPSLSDPGSDLPAPPSAEPAPDPVDGPSTAPTTTPALSLDGEMPRLGSGAVTPVLSTEAAPAEPVIDAAELPSLPTTTPAPPQPATAPPVSTSAVTTDVDLPSLPSLPTTAPVTTQPATADEAARHEPLSAGDSSPDIGSDGEPAPANEHPMAHLMGTTNPPSEASRKAAEIRAAKKAKARKIKLGVAAGALVVAVAVGPPLFRWLGNAINEAGSTSTEQPAD